MKSNWPIAQVASLIVLESVECWFNWWLWPDASPSTPALLLHIKPAVWGLFTAACEYSTIDCSQSKGPAACMFALLEVWSANMATQWRLFSGCQPSLFFQVHSMKMIIPITDEARFAQRVVVKHTTPPPWQLRPHRQEAARFTGRIEWT